MRRGGVGPHIVQREAGATTITQGRQHGAGILGRGAVGMGQIGVACGHRRKSHAADPAGQVKDVNAHPGHGAAIHAGVAVPVGALPPAVGFLPRDEQWLADGALTH